MCHPSILKLSQLASCLADRLIFRPKWTHDVLCLIALAAVAMPAAAEPPAVDAESGAEPIEISPLEAERIQAAHDERPDDDYVDVSELERRTEPARRWRRGGHTSVQVNVDAMGNNIVGDAANEPSIAVDPTNTNRLAIGWRQFDTITNNFRQAGFGSSIDGGQSWTAGVIEGGIFRSDPVLDADGEGNFYYNSLGVPGGTFSCDVFRSSDGGATWDAGVFAAGGDKQWMAIDRRTGLGGNELGGEGPLPGAGHIYSNWNQSFSCCGATGFVRSVDSGDSYESPISIPQQPFWGTTAVGPNGEVYVVGRNGAGQIVVAKSTTLRDPAQTAAFDSSVIVDLGGSMRASTGPNPGGLLGQVWVAVDTSNGPRSGWVYVLSSVDPSGADPMDVHMVRSEDGGATWSPPLKINQEADGANAWQWFGTLSVAPNGRLDAIWNDTQDDPGGFDSVLTYAYSLDGGVTWSSSQALSPSFDPHIGWPQQNKIGDYYDMVSQNDAAHLAYSATFNGEQDVYYLRIEMDSFVFNDGFEVGNTSAWSLAVP